VRLIDLEHLGRPRVIGCWEVGEVLVDPGPSSCLPKLLSALGARRPRALLLTHIHLDHAGASGSLVRHWPELEVYVHEVGAPHMIDPEKLLKSARRLYGEGMDELWGEFLPVPESQVRILEGGERLSIAGAEFDVLYTPGHASHHVSYLHDGTAFVGDVGGVQITSAGPVIPPTPPPDIDLDAWKSSIDAVAEWRPRRLVRTHFGAGEDVGAQLHEVKRRLGERARRAREQDHDQFVAQVRGEIESEAEPGTAAAYEQAAPADQMYQGLERYWRKATVKR
jgi:glyoxylase-like metal-dependent hydrolase (beta-lactamase superfamily II)